MECIAVVPVFVSAGAAVLPTIAAALTSMVAIALRPSELLRFVRQRPIVAGVWAGGIAIVSWGTCWWWTSDQPAPTAEHREARYGGGHYDWAKVAEDLIALERAGQPPTLLGNGQASNSLSGQATPSVPHSSPRDLSHDTVGNGSSPTDLKILWNYRPEETMFLSAPAVADKRVYAAGCQTDLGGYTGLLACLDRDTGKPLWQVTQAGDELLRPFFSSPALSSDGKYLVIGQGLHADRDCSLLCFETATGQLHWAVKTPSHIESSPTIFGDLAIVGVGAIEGTDGRAIGDPGYVLAIRISDGKTLWRQPVNDPESSPTVDEAGTVYIGSGFNGNAIVAIRSHCEEQLRQDKLDRVAWRTSVAYPMTGAMTLVDDWVVAGGGNSDMVHSNRNAQGIVVALDRKSGQIRWEKRFDDGVLGAIACRDEMMVCPVRTGEVVALNLKNGEILWRSAISGNAPVLAGCALTDQCVYAVSNDGFLAVLDFKSGKVLEKTYLNDEARPGSGLTLCPPRVVEGQVFVGSETGGLSCLIGSESSP